MAPKRAVSKWRYFFIAFILLNVMFSFPVLHMIDRALEHFYPYRHFHRRINRTIFAFNEALIVQRDYINFKMLGREFPPLGIYHIGALCYTPKKEFWEAYRDWEAYRSRPYHYQTIVSLDYKERKLYAGFANVYFLKDSFPKKYRYQMVSWLLEKNKYEKGLLESKLFVQNAKGEEYTEGDIVLTLVAILSSDDIINIQNDRQTTMKE
jgi:hypothetical protein